MLPIVAIPLTLVSVGACSSVVALTSTSVSGRASFVATGTTTKQVAAAFQLSR